MIAAVVAYPTTTLIAAMTVPLRWGTRPCPLPAMSPPTCPQHQRPNLNSQGTCLTTSLSLTLTSRRCKWCYYMTPARGILC